MSLNPFKISWRILTKYKANTIINLSGMIVAFTSTVLILVFILHELDFDNFHEKGERIYRLNSAISMADAKEIHATISNGKLPALLLQKMPEIESITRFYYWGTNEIKHDKKQFTTDKLFWVDTSFFNIFSFDLVKGNELTCLKEPNSLILTETFATKIFGNDNPINKSLTIGSNTYLVTAIIEDAPTTSHLQFDMLASMSTIENAKFDVAVQNVLDFTFYVLLKDGVNFTTFHPKFSKICDDHVSENFGSFGIKLKHSLQPLEKVHLYSNFDFDRAVTGDLKNIKIFSILSVFILLIASLNYINLMTAQSEVRLRESGIRKVLGADKFHLIKLYLFESIIICMSALFLAFGLADLLIKVFGNLLDTTLNTFDVFDIRVIVIMLIITLITSIASGVYPALIVSRANPAKILKGSKGNKVNSNFSKYLVAVQFGITIFLIITVLIINQQVRYMKYKDLGFEKDNLITVTNISKNIINAYPSVRARLLENTSFENVTASQDIPGITYSTQNCFKYGEDPNTGFIVNEIRLQDHYVKTFGFKIIQGRDYHVGSRSDSNSFVINQAAAKKLGFKDPIGKKIVIWQQPGTIIGVVSDFHITSLHKPVEPLIFTHYQKWFNNITVKVKESGIKESLGYLEKTIKEADPNYNFNYVFVNDTFKSMYSKEERLNEMMTSGSVIAIIISIMGLFSLTAFSVRRRVKEIGIRKTLGASVQQILILISGKILIWMIPGMLIAFPFAWWAAENWLSGFAYRIELIHYWWVWILSGIIALMVGFLTIYYQSVKTANTNPVDCLKYE